MSNLITATNEKNAHIKSSMVPTAKQRPLTAKQRKLLAMQQAGVSIQAIADALSISVGTVYAKQTALRKGIKKGAYSDIRAVPVNGTDFVTKDLFEESGEL